MHYLPPIEKLKVGDKLSEEGQIIIITKIQLPNLVYSYYELDGETFLDKNMALFYPGDFRRCEYVVNVEGFEL